MTADLSSILTWISGGAASETTWMLTRWVFLRALGVVYLIAFASLWIQIKGLIGSGGILPVEDFLGALKNHYGGERFLAAPTVFWLNASDIMLHVVCALGVGAAVALIIGFAPMPSLILLWALYLSVTTVGQSFLSFQWDVLLIEVGFFAIFFAPLNIMPGLIHETPVSPLALLLLQFILFRLMFESGVVKLNSGDKTWLDFTALNFHYFTQPLPNGVSWFVHNLPLGFHKLSMLVMYAGELVAPFFVFAFIPRTLRTIAFSVMLVLFVAITVTGNYNFFVLLAGALALLMLDDTFWTRVLPENVLEFIGQPTLSGALPQPFTIAIVVLAVFTIIIGSKQLLRTLGVRVAYPGPIESTIDAVDQFRSINSYGLFRVMTKNRPEIIIEGSNDREQWFEYEFIYKPNSNLARKPRSAQPHQPRLDWQMWFAALSSFERTPWFHNFLVRLLEGSPDVLALLRANPFPEGPPKYVRAVLYHYEFTTPDERRATGHFWKRQQRGLFSPVLSLK